MIELDESHEVSLNNLTRGNIDSSTGDEVALKVPVTPEGVILLNAHLDEVKHTFARLNVHLLPDVVSLYREDAPLQAFNAGSGMGPTPPMLRQSTDMIQMTRCTGHWRLNIEKQDVLDSYAMDYMTGLVLSYALVARPSRIVLDHYIDA